MTRFQSTLRGLTTITVIAGSLAAARAGETITFDSLSGFTYDAPISNGYAGFDWLNIYVMDAADFAGYGYGNGDASPPNDAFNGGGSPGYFSSSTPFELTSIDMTAAFTGPETATLTGFNSLGVQIDQTTVSLVATGPTLETFDWAGLSRVEFSASQGNVVFDNIAIDGGAAPASGVPDSGATAALLTAGLAGLAAVRRRSRR